MLVADQAGVYEKLCTKQGVHLEILERVPGMTTLRATGKKAAALFEDESGGHRWQRIPPNEKRGRVHTSTVTVAILPEPTETEVKLDPKDLDIKATRGSGPGGQHRNKTETCISIKHIPTGLMVRCDEERSQGLNKDLALALLRARI